MENKFEVFGYYKDYYKNGKWIGSENISEPDREVFGYYGRKTEVSKTTMTLSNKKKIHKGEKYTTELMMLCGKMKNRIRVY